MAKVKAVIRIEVEVEDLHDETIKQAMYSLLSDKMDEDELYDDNTKTTVIESDDEDAPEGDEDEDD